MDLISAIKTIASPLCEKPDFLDIREKAIGDNEIEITITSNKEDTARLIGRQGVIATSIRQLVSAKQRGQGKRVKVTFESYE